jgi:L-iditol 2-dehydrogenase
VTFSKEIPKTSRAAVITAFGEPLEIRDLPVPALAPGSLLVEIELATVCGSDVHVWEGSQRRARRIDLPIVPGHEMVGRIVAFGDGPWVDSVGAELSLGDRVVWDNASCGRCFNCTVAGQPNLCANRQTFFAVNCDKPPHIVGGFSQYAYVPPRSGSVRVPDTVKTEWASAASCALRSVIRGFQRLGTIEPWQTVVIQGSGPLGLFATAVADHAGAARVIVIGGPEDRLAVAREWGATDTVSISDHSEPQDRTDAIRQLTGGLGAEIVIEVSGARTAFREGIDMTRRGGRYVVVGQTVPHEVTVEPAKVTTGQLTILGSYSGEAPQYWRALQFLDRTKHKYNFDRVVSNRYGLHEATLAMNRMQSFDEIKPVVVPSLTGNDQVRSQGDAA